MIKKILIMIMVLYSLLANQVFAEITLRTSTDVSPLYVGKIDVNGDFSGWKKEITLSENDRTVVFHIHAYANGGDIKSLISKMEDLREKVFSKGNKYSVSGSVSAANADQLEDNVSLYFKDSLRFEYERYTWAIKLKGANPEENEHFQTLPYGQIGTDTFSEKGVALGDLPEEYRSNLLVYFNIVDLNTVKRSDGVCSAKYNKCLKGDFVDIQDTNTNYLWQCRGSNGGITDACSMRKNPVNAVCGLKVNECQKGTFLDEDDTDMEFLWICKGKNSGQDKNCKLKKEIFDGVCGTKLNTCKKGKFTKYDDNEYYQRWKCQGKNGGRDQICLADKMCRCSKIKEAIENCQHGNSNFKNYTKEDSEEKIGNVQGPQQVRDNEKTSGGWLHWINYFILIFIIIILSIRLVARRK